MSDGDSSVSGRDRLVESLWLDARREADQELQRARAEAERLQNESRINRDREMSMAAEKAHDEAGPQVSRILNRAHSRVRRLLLEGRYGFLDSCFDEVSETIGLDSRFRERARAALPGVLEQVMAVMDGRKSIQVRINPDDMETALTALKGGEPNSKILADDRISGGVLITADDGSIIVDCTVEGKLKTLRETPPVDLLKLLVPNDGG